MVANAHKPIRQHMHQEATHELQGGKGHLFGLAIDGLSYASERDTQYETRPTEEDPNVDQYCYVAGTGVSNWQPGVTYQIRFGMILDTDLFDGWNNFSAGDYLHRYLLTGQ